MTKKDRKEYILASLTLVIGGALLAALIMIPKAAPAEAVVPPVTVISETTTTYTEVITDFDGDAVNGNTGPVEMETSTSNW